MAKGVISPAGLEVGMATSTEMFTVRKNRFKTACMEFLQILLGGRRQRWEIRKRLIIEKPVTAKKARGQGGGK